MVSLTLVAEIGDGEGIYTKAIGSPTNQDSSPPPWPQLIVKHLPAIRPLPVALSPILWDSSEVQSREFPAFLEEEISAQV